MEAGRLASPDAGRHITRASLDGHARHWHGGIGRKQVVNGGGRDPDDDDDDDPGDDRDDRTWRFGIGDKRLAVGFFWYQRNDLVAHCRRGFRGLVFPETQKINL